MVCSCCVRGCTNSVSTNKVSSPSRTSISLYRLPRIRVRYSKKYQKLLQKQRLAWFAALRRNELSLKKDWLRICSEHFASGTPADFRDTENPDWVPHLKMGYEASDDEYESDEQKPFIHDNNENHFAEIDSQLSPDQETSGKSNVIETSGVGVQTDLTNSYITALEAELRKRNEEIYDLRARLADALWTEESFKNNDKKMSYYSGLPSYKLFRLILDQIEPALSKISIQKIDNFQKLLLTLMKLRFNMAFKDLGYRFRVCGATVSNCFKKVIVLIAYTFQGFVHWPDRDALRTATPQCFKKAFGNSIAVITDYLEMATQKPGNAKARAESLSNCEHNYTAKYLVGITPHGFVSFISDGWEGRASDQYISEHSGLLDNLIPGDVVMSDRGFTIKESVSMHYAELLTPAFLQNKMQLAPEDVEKIRKIASVRIHVKRIISLLKNKFQILRGPISTDLLKFKHDGKPLLDYVVRSACILTNLCDSIVPMGEPLKKNDNVNVLRDSN